MSSLKGQLDLSFDFLRWILTLGHIVRLTMLAECGISTQNKPENQEKGHCRSPANVT